VTKVVFHEGERAMQARVGVEERLALVGAQVIRSYMPEQHRDFFHALPFIIIGSLDGTGQAWASMLAGPPGFIDSLDAERLVIHTLPSSDSPLALGLAAGMSVGMLGIEPHTRRRNRMNGVVAHVGADGFEVNVRQSFGNCPKYIQARRPAFSELHRPAMEVIRNVQLDADAKALIAAADTFFIATAHPAAASGSDRANGVDVSHRGGRPGFIRIDDDSTVTVPDFVGNNFFNTLGNLMLNPRAGLLFVDYVNGDLLHIAVEVQIIEEATEVAAFAGAQRLMRLRIRETLLVPGAQALTWSEAELSPHLAATGHW
jgi:predicted pyridoxine 5'-phosphate oxidase superfamily flavin-nucleotide-binding protein